MRHLYLQGNIQVTGDEYKLNTIRDYLKGALLDSKDYIGNIVVTFNDEYSFDIEWLVNKIVHKAIENECVTNGKIIYTDLNGNGHNGVFLIENNKIKNQDDL